MPSKLQAVILDWAGTTVDYGSRAPTQVFLEIFRRRGIDITVAEARGPMGMAKRAHISAVISLPRVSQLWQQVHGHPPVDGDVQAMYDEFLPLQLETLARGSEMIPGVVDAIAACRQMGLKIGSTTGYTRALMEVVAPPAARCGYSPDCIICSDDVTAGRPAPWMNFHAAEQLNVFPMDSVIVVDDTPVGIAAGRSAGCITVGVSQTGNALGLSQPEVESFSTEDLNSRLAEIERDFIGQGAHYVLRSVSELPKLIRKLSTAPT